MKFRDLFKIRASKAAWTADLEQIFSRAKLLQKNGDIEAAAVAYRSILQADPSHWESANAIASITLQSGDFQRAVGLYGELIARKGDHSDSYFKRANAFNGLGKWEAALADYDRAVALNPVHAKGWCNRGAVLQSLGRWGEALESYDRALHIDPEDFLTHYNRGSVLRQLQRLDDALASYDLAIASNEANPDVHVNRGNVLRELRKYADAIASYDKAVSLSPDAALRSVAFYDRGLALAELTRYEDALASYDEAIKLDPPNFLAHSSRGWTLKKMQRFEDALASYEQAIALNDSHAESYFYRGQLLHEMLRYTDAVESFKKAIERTPRNLAPYLAHSSRGFSLAALKRFDEALVCFDQAIAIKNDYIEAHCARGHVLQELRRYEDAIASYDDAIALDPTGPQAFPTYCSRGFSFKELKRLDEALESYDRAIDLKSDDIDVYMNKGGVLQELGRHKEALCCFDEALELKSDFVEALQGRAFSLLNRGRHEEAIASFDQAILLKPDQKYLQGFKRYAQMQICDWDNFLSYIGELERQLLARRPISAPFQVLALVDSPRLHRLAAEVWSEEEFPPDLTLGIIPRSTENGRIRIGYFSADFRNHPVALLTAQLFEAHDRSRFEIIAFAFGPRVSDPVRTRLERAFDRFIDVSDRSDLEVAETARSLRLDIAVDLGGFTEFARPRVFSLRAAPIQMSYIGYLGTMGASYMDYLISDPFIVPLEDQPFYSEKIIYLPSYQVNDSKRKIIESSITRQELGLPASGFVFSCFNANYKITPSTFSSWMRILQRVDGSWLFLYAGSEIAERNLRKEAQRLGVDPTRIVFGKYLPNEEYLARFRTMDLFLDTLPYNAGTTASDALWAGLPVITCVGRAFAGRVAASLLYAIGLNELVTWTPEEYEDLAVHLAENSSLMMEIKQKLARNRLNSALFDTVAFTRHLEIAYTAVHERYVKHLEPETIFVTSVERYNS